MSEEEARGFFKQLLSGIACIHENGFCHRDIKPENCMIETATGTLKIIDFGLSKHLDSAKTVGIGTPDYMCPEMLTGSSHQPGHAGGPGGGGAGSGPGGAGMMMHYNPEAVDVWAMGVMLYLMLTGTYPFEDFNQPGNITATLRRVREGRMNRLPTHLSQPVRDLLLRMIQVDPVKRTTLKAIAAHSWIVAGESAQEEQQRQFSGGAADRNGVVAAVMPPGLAPLNVGGGGGGGGGMPAAALGSSSSHCNAAAGATIVGRINSGLHKFSKFMSMNLGGGGSGGGGNGGGAGTSVNATTLDGSEVNATTTAAQQQQHLQEQQQQQQHKQQQYHY